MSNDQIIKKLAKQLNGGNIETPVSSIYGVNLPDETALRERVDDFFSSARVPGGTPHLRSELDQILNQLYGTKPVPGKLFSHMSTEAVVVADGSRPVFFVQDDKLNTIGKPDGPFVDFVTKNVVALQSMARSVGRVETDDRMAPPETDKWYEGTAFMVAPGVAMTNRHVLERIVFENTSDSGPFTLRARYWLNFDAEYGNTQQTRFAVDGILYVGEQVIGSGGDITKLDLALLKIGKPEKPEAVLPAPLPLTYRTIPNGTKVALIGYPAAPRIYTGNGIPPADYELESVMKNVFDARFGYKRCASGQVIATPGFPTDNQRWTIQHDASTLSGNSGSPVVGLIDGDMQVSALHFSGLPRQANFAHVFETLTAALRPYGLLSEK
ncbi:MAG TPA: hypothetical protein DCQ33_01015 [Nitrospira sp.]|jgi:V8-like Glu-specific endopeptidase|nr:hypothetical protein [Nitrospira sp.]